MSSRASVLVIDDEPGIRDLLSWELSQDGFDVEAAASGMAAVEAAKRRKFDLAVTDLKMPGMDGIATIDALRAMDPDIEVIVATGYATVETAIACMKRGAYDYIQKPYDLNELKLLLEKAAQKSQLQGIVALYEASRVLLSTLKHADLMRIVLGLAQKVLRADDVALLLTNLDSDRFEFHRADGSVSPREAELIELARRAEREGAPMRFPATPGQAPGAEDGGADCSSALVYPLATSNRRLGVLVASRRGNSPAFVHSELQKGTVFASQLALSLDNAHIHDELQKKIDELLATREQLVRAEKLALAAHLAEAVAHEINNPLAYVRANLDALQDYSSSLGSLWLAAKGAALYLRGQVDPEAHQHARNLSAVPGDEGDSELVVRDIAGLISETLDGVKRIADLVAGFKQLAAPPEPSRAEAVRPLAILSECVESLRPTARRPIAMASSGADDRAMAAASSDDLRAAMLNILSYLTAREPTDGRVPGRIVVQSGLQNGRLEVLIGDETLRLSEDEQRRLFDPRIEVTTKHGRTMRLNLGLALAYHLLARNHVEVQVEAGDGAQFRLVFPKSQPVRQPT